jgi:hypothetical protein
MLACKLLKMSSVNGHFPVSETAAKRMRKKSASDKARKTRAGAHAKKGAKSGEPQLAAAGSLTRTKALLLAALRVWELKHRISE